MDGTLQLDVSLPGTFIFSFSSLPPPSLYTPAFPNKVQSGQGDLGCRELPKHLKIVFTLD